MLKYIFTQAQGTDGRSQLYLGHIFGIDWAYLGHILGILWIYLWCIFGIYWAYLDHILEKYWPYLGHLLGISIFGLYQSSPGHILGHSEWTSYETNWQMNTCTDKLIKSQDSSAQIEAVLKLFWFCGQIDQMSL